MYLQYYNLREAPFNITPDPRFLFFSAKHQEAFNHLLFGIRERKGFIELTGEVGAGKTTLCRKLLEELGPTYKTALILNPCLSSHQLIKTIAMEFGLKARGIDRVAYLQAINDFVLAEVNQGHDVVLVIDEAQNLSDELLEQVGPFQSRNRSTKAHANRPDGTTRTPREIAAAKTTATRQRITVRYHSVRSTQSETAAYINHRLTSPLPTARRVLTKARPIGLQVFGRHPATDQRRL